MAPTFLAYANGGNIHRKKARLAGEDDEFGLGMSYVDALEKSKRKYAEGSWTSRSEEKSRLEMEIWESFIKS